MRSPWIAVTATGVALVLGAGLWGTVGVAALAVSVVAVSVVASGSGPTFFGEYPPYVLVRERLRADLRWG